MPLAAGFDTNGGGDSRWVPDGAVMAEVFSWTRGRKDMLCREYPQKTASQIAAVLGCSRNAVIGKANRLGLRKRETSYLWRGSELVALRRAMGRKNNGGRNNTAPYSLAYGTVGALALELGRTPAAIHTAAQKLRRSLIGS
jgi:hypothetical protein